MKKILKKTEFYIFLVIVILGIVIQVKSNQFFTGNNFVDLMRATIVPGMFSIGTFMIIVSGGIDVSFPAVASLVAYAVTKIMIYMDYQGTVLLPMLLAAAMGILLGAVNGWFIGKMKLPALIVTLGTQSVFRGILQGVLNAQQIDMLPEGMLTFGKRALYTSYSESGMASVMPIAVLFFIATVVVAVFIMRYTMLGRGIYAVGGDENSAIRAGFRVLRIKMFVYCFAGMIAGVAGIIRVCMMSMVHPTNMLGMEMTVIAAVVLGGASLAGGIGTLTGTVLGVALLTIVENSLILIGIPSYWQQFFTGALIIVGTAVSSMQIFKKHKRVLAQTDE